jgi:predicted MFS family arabinose efflux permease
MAAESHAPRSRWLILACYSLLVASTQVLWLTFAPITTDAHRLLGVSEGAIGDLAGINPLVYVLLALPTGRWTDRNYGQALGAGAALTALGATLRWLGPDSYPLILAGQALIAIAQPLVLNSTTKVAARYFPAGERTAAISVASAAQFVGILFAASTGEWFFQGGGLPRLLLAHAVIAVVAALAVAATLRVPAPYVWADEPGDTGDPAGSGARSLRWLRHDPVLWRLGVMLFIGVGVFNAVATWLDSVLTAFGHPNSAGDLITVMTVTGIFGAATLPTVAARLDARRWLLSATIGITVMVFGSLAVAHDYRFIVAALAVEGFALLACLPVALDWSELRAGPERAGTATGFLLLAGNLGGAVLVLVIQLLIRHPELALGCIALLATPGLWVAAGLPGREAAVAESH